jgi:5'(3')-deoxyribonucleotidase
VKPRVLLDCDNVLSDFVTPMLRVLSEITGRPFTPKDVTEYDIMRSLGISRDDAERAYEVAKKPEFCLNLPVFQGTQKGVARLQEFATVYIVTTPLDGIYWASEREEWLYDNFGISRKCVVSTPAKYLVSGDVIVDDKTITLVQWLKYQSGLAVQWEQPHNRNDGWTGPSTDNWDELIGMVKLLAGRPKIEKPFWRAVPGSEKAV